MMWVGLAVLGCQLGLEEYAGDPDEVDAASLGDDPLPARLWRLTAEEYRASVAALLGDEVLAADTRTIADGQDDHGFTNGAASLQVRFEQATDFLHAAEAYAEVAHTRVPDLCGCDPEPAAEEACARSCLDDLGRQAYRRPLTSEEQDQLWQAYLEGREPDFEDGIELAIATMLVSPSFLYRSELGDPATEDAEGLRVLTPFETAAALSYMMTGGPPDEALWAAAAAGELADPDERAAHAERLYPRAGDRLADFVRRWLRVHDLTNMEKQSSDYPEYGEALLDEMVEETETFVRNHLVLGDRRYDTLLSSSATWVGPRLADVYGVAPGEVELNPDERAGVLTQPLVLARHSTYDSSAPVYRGAFVWRDLFCEPLPSPPPEAVEAGRMALAETESLPATTRERTEIMTGGDACVGCHALINPIGFTFEHYDAIGAYRSSENGSAIDPSGALPRTLDVGGPLIDAVDLAAALAESEEVQRCFLRRLTQHALGTDPGPVDESAWLNGASESFRAANTDLRAYLVQLVRNERFVQRQFLPAERTP